MGQLTAESDRQAALGKLERKADHLKNTLVVLDRLSGEAEQRLDVLGHTLYELGKLTAPINQRATALTIAQGNVAASKHQLDQLLEHLDASRRVKPALAQGPVKDLEAFLDGLHQLEHSNAALYRHNKLAAARQALSSAQGVFDSALEQCGNDFTATLAQGSKLCLPSPSWINEQLGQLAAEGTYPPVHPLVPEHLLPKLQRMAELMKESQYTAPHAAYTSVRGRMMQQALVAACPELPPASSLAGLAPEQVERVMVSWTQHLRVTALLSVSEKALAVEVWGEDLGPELFAGVVRGQLQGLVATGRELIEARRSPDKLFSLLEMHRQLSALLPSLELVLGASPATAPLLNELRQLRVVVATAASSMWSEYEESVGRDVGKVLPLDGTIHPLTAQVVSYVKRLLTHSNASEVLYGAPSSSSQGGGEGQGPGEAEASTLGPLSMGVTRLLMQLLDNLEGKAKAYKNEPLAALFLMNNVHYVQWSVEHSAALGLLGNEWLERHKDLVEDWGARYHDLVWMPLVASLQAPPPSDMARLKQSLKDTFSAFNGAIERIYTSQSGWTIPDNLLRDAVKRVIKDDLVPPYESFLRQYADVQFTSNPAKYIKYAVADVVALINDDLFETKAVSSGKLSLRKEKLDAIV